MLDTGLPASLQTHTTSTYQNIRKRFEEATPLEPAPKDKQRHTAVMYTSPETLACEQHFYLHVSTLARFYLLTSICTCNHQYRFARQNKTPDRKMVVGQLEKSRRASVLSTSMSVLSMSAEPRTHNHRLRCKHGYKYHQLAHGEERHGAVLADHKVPVLRPCHLEVHHCAH